MATGVLRFARTALGTHITHVIYNLVLNRVISVLIRMQGQQTELNFKRRRYVVVQEGNQQFTER